jgi:DNA-binding XRE family transcriptional regulator
MEKIKSVQIIHDDQGHPAFAVLPWEAYERLRAGGGEDAMLIAAGNAARGDETFPAEVAARLVAGESSLKVFREWRGMTQQQLSDASGVANQYISQIERAVRSVGRKVAQKLAGPLGVSESALLD